MVRFGIIGTNKITGGFLAAAQKVEGFKLNAVYSRTEEKAREFADKYSVKNIFTDLNEMAKSDLIDAVYIASPNSLHASQSIIFLRNKKHVLCEKPVTSNAGELKKVIEAAGENNVLFMEAMKQTFLPNFKAIKDNLHKIGKVRRYFASYCQYSSRYDLYKEGKNPNTFNPEFSNGSLMDIGVYCLYPVIALFGKPKEIKANALLLESGVDGEGSLCLKYDDMDAVIMHSKITNSSLPSEIQGENGNIIMNKVPLLKNVSIAYRNGEVEDITREQLENDMCYEIEEFISLVNNNKIESETNTHQLSLDVMEVMDEARRQVGLNYPADR